jgi:hypothetical protein
MKTPQIVQKVSALSLMAGRCNVEPAKLHSTLKNTVFKGASDDELLALVVTESYLTPLVSSSFQYETSPFVRVA